MCIHIFKWHRSMIGIDWDFCKMWILISDFNLWLCTVRPWIIILQRSAWPLFLLISISRISLYLNVFIIGCDAPSYLLILLFYSFHFFSLFFAVFCSHYFMTYRCTLALKLPRWIHTNHTRPHRPIRGRHPHTPQTHTHRR